MSGETFLHQFEGRARQMSIVNSDAVPIWQHKTGTQSCDVGECRYRKRRIGQPGGLDLCACGGVVHAVDADWRDYDFGSGRGPVYFDLCCDKCGASEKAHAG